MLIGAARRRRVRGGAPRTGLTAEVEGSVVGRALLAVVTFGALHPGVLRGRRAEVSVRTAESEV